MKDGLYRVHFQTPAGWGSGVVHAIGGKLWGGDMAMFYTGSYSTDGEKLKAEVSTGRHSHPPGVTSVFGRDEVRISLSGVWTAEGAKLSGRAAELPTVLFSAELTRIAD